MFPLHHEHAAHPGAGMEFLHHEMAMRDVTAKTLAAETMLVDAQRAAELRAELESSRQGGKMFLPAKRRGK